MDRGALHRTSSTPPFNTSKHAAAFMALAPVFFYFVIAGITTVMLGPLLPALIQHWHIQDAQAGTLFTASFAGQLCGAWFAVRSVRASVLYGAFLSALGCIAMPWAGFGTAHVALFCIGVGLGAGVTAGTVIAGTALPSSGARLMAALNVAWGLGAIICPILVHASGPAGLHLFFFLTSGLLAVASLFAIAIPRPTRLAAEDPPSPSSAPRTYAPKMRIPLPLVTLLLFAAAMLLYVGVENALAGWLPSYAIRSSPLLQAASISLYFWIAEIGGRLLLAVFTTSTSETTLYRVCLALLILTQVLLCTTTHPSASSIVIFTILCALTLAPIYPLLTAFLLSRTGSHPRLGPIFSAASLGGATLPWFTGILSTRFHSLRAGLIVPAAGAILLLLLSTVTTSKPKEEPAA